jgi:ribosomal protein S6--L-glutamate ligase
MTNGKRDGERLGRIGVAVEDRYRTQPQPAGMIAALASFGDVELVEVRETTDLAGCDVLVARGRSAVIIGLLGAAEALGVRTINTAGAVRGVLDKIVMHNQLVAAGVAVPETWTGPFSVLRRHLGGQRDPLVVKPVFGDNCRDVTVVADGDALQEMVWNEPRAIVQRHLPNDRFDVKLYGIGDDVWVVRKPSPLYRDSTGSAPSASSTLVATTEHVALAHRCRDAFGLDLYGVDCIATDDGLVVIEVNDFPNYTGIVDADEHLARFAVAALDRRLVVAS